MQTLAMIELQQQEWAAHAGLPFDSDGYLADVKENLFASLSHDTKAEFQAAPGNELEDRTNEPAKMRALHSSSALVCNIFDYWRHVDPAAVGRALGLPLPIAYLQFEKAMPTGLRGTPPTLDLLLSATGAQAWGVESKFTEPFRPHSRAEPFADSYFLSAPGLWAQSGLPGCQSVAERPRDGRLQFSHLDAAQLLKHTLGIRRRFSDGGLVYLWFSADSSEARMLAEEVGRFAEAVDDALGFRAITHQEVFERLSAERSADPCHLDYLRRRYFSA